MSDTHLSDSAIVARRVKQHAKLIDYRGRQVLAFLVRDADDRLQVTLQMWVANTDEQIQIAVKIDGVGLEAAELFAQSTFDNLSPEEIDFLFEEIGLPEFLAENGEQI